jgi:acyl-coenzyme A synthetase/AMP-(fatty) acid ligase
MISTENIITRHCLNQDLLIYQHNDTLQLDHKFDYVELCHMIDYWKVLLVEKYAVTVGQTCYLDLVQQDIYYYSLFFAICELGLIIVVDLPRVGPSTDLKTDHRLNMHGQIDFWFADSLTLSHPYNELRFKHIGRQVIEPCTEFNNYTVLDHDRFAEIAGAIWCAPNMPLIWTSSSGTTNTPKKVVESHHKIYTMSRRMVPLLNFEKSDVVCHTKNIHHGSSLVLFFLPSFMACDHHLTRVWNALESDSVSELVSFVEQEKPNHVFLYTTNLLTEFLQKISVWDRRLELLTLYHVTPEIIQLQKLKNVDMIRSTYGESTIGSAILLKHVNKDVDISTYEINNMGPKMDDYYELDIVDGKLAVSIPMLDQPWRSTGDVFTVSNDNYYFHGRSDLYRIGYSWIKFSELEQEVNDQFGTDKGKPNANAVIDANLQKLYLAVWNKVSLDAVPKFVEHLKEKYDGYEVLKGLFQHISSLSARKKSRPAKVTEA